MAVTRYRYFTDTLAASAQKFVNIVGNYIYLIANTGAAATLQVSFDDGEFQTLPVGIILKTSDFQKITIRNNDVGSATFTYAIGYGDIDNKAFTLATTIVSNNSSTAMNTPAAITGSTTASVILAANTNRRRALVQNNGTAGEVVYIGDSSVNAATNRGIAISNGDVIELQTQGAIWQDSVSGTPVLSLLEETGT